MLTPTAERWMFALGSPSYLVPIPLPSRGTLPVIGCLAERRRHRFVRENPTNCMSNTTVATAANPQMLIDKLPAAPGNWERNEEPGGIVEYRLPDKNSPCTAAKIAVRPDILSDATVRLVRKRGCSDAGSNTFDSLDAAVDAVSRELNHVLAAVSEDEAR